MIFFFFFQLNYNNSNYAHCITEFCLWVCVMDIMSFIYHTATKSRGILIVVTRLMYISLNLHHLARNMSGVYEWDVQFVNPTSSILKKKRNYDFVPSVNVNFTKPASPCEKCVGVGPSQSYWRGLPGYGGCFIIWNVCNNL